MATSQQLCHHQLPPAAEAPSASAIQRAFNKQLLKVQLLHTLHHQSPMELGEATRMTHASSDHPDSIQHLLRRLLERKSSCSSASVTSLDISDLLESSMSSSSSSSRAPSFFRD